MKIANVRTVWGVSFGLLLASLTQGLAYAQKAGCSSSFHQCRGGGGNDVPTPFDFRGQKFELADGELYVLAGKVIISSSVFEDSGQKMAYLQIDLDKQGWLAGFQRREFPYYPLEADPRDWTAFEQKEVRILVKAHGRIIGNGNQAQYVIYLEPITRQVLP